MADQEALINLLIACTVRVEEPNAHGTGFFVAPGLVLTCAHVIQEAAGNPAQLAVYCNDTRQTVPVVEIVACLSHPYPDLALLRIDRRDHPCVYLDSSIKIDAKMFTFGYSEKHVKGDSLTLKYEGPMYLDADQLLYKLEEGQVEPGFSGAPLLNFGTGAVCGLIKLTRDPTIDLGGGAVPSKVILQQLPDLEQLNAEFHRTDLRWTEAREQMLPPPKAVTVSAVLWSGETEVVNKPQLLVGRGQLLAEIAQCLKEARRVLLVGLGGIGKTALAAYIAQQYLAGQHSSVLWLQADAGQADSLIEALAEGLGGKFAVMSQIGVAQITALQQLLSRSEISLLVIDDVQIGAALHTILQAIPGDLPVLVTSRQRLGNLHVIEVGDLPPDAALQLLGYHAEQDFATDPDATRLCRLLGCHPYAVELAGTTLHVDYQTPGELCQVLAEAPYLLSAPGDYAPAGHESLKALLDESVNSLDAATRKVFTTFGAFSTSGVTSDLLAMYLGRSPEEIQKPIGELVRRSLAKRQLSTNYYFLHDLTFSYAQGRFKAEKYSSQQIISVIEEFSSAHAQAYDQLGLNLSNILGAVAFADGETLVRIMSWIAFGGYPTPQGRSYLDERGHTLALLDKLDKAIEAARQINSTPKETLHYLLSKRGNAYFDRRDFDHAIETYQTALDLAPNTTRRAVLLSVMGQTFAEQHHDVEAEKYFQQAYQLSKSTKDDYALSFVLEYRSIHAGRTENYRAARRYAAEAVKINRRINNPTRLGYSLLNLGSSELDLDRPSRALEIHQEALDLSVQTGDLQLKSEVLHALAEDHHQLHHHTQAQEQLAEALEICRQTGDTEHEKRIMDFIKKHRYAVQTTRDSTQ